MKSKRNFMNVIYFGTTINGTSYYALEGLEEDVFFLIPNEYYNGDYMDNEVLSIGLLENEYKTKKVNSKTIYEAVKEISPDAFSIYKKM